MDETPKSGRRKSAAGKGRAKVKKKEESDEEEEKPKSTKKPAAKPRKQSAGSTKKGTGVKLNEDSFLRICEALLQDLGLISKGLVKKKALDLNLWINATFISKHGIKRAFFLYIPKFTLNLQSQIFT